jgi:hypothetical protein
MTGVRRRWRIAAGLGAAAVALAGCSASGGGSESKGSADSAAVTSQARGVKQEAVPAAPGQQVQRAPARDSRSIVYKGDITVRVQDVSGRAAAASTIATAADGFVAGDNRRSGGEDASADLILRVPAKEFGPTVDKLAKLGTEADRSIGTEDVTDKSADLDARLASKKASVERTRALLSKADRIADIVAIEGELASREADLGSLEAEQRALADQVTLSTITLHLVKPTAVIGGTDKPGFLSGLAAGWRAFTASLRWLLVVVGVLLPFAIPVAIAAVVWVRLARRRKPAAPAPQPAPAPAP